MSSDPRFEEGLRLILEAIEASRRDNEPPLSAQQMAHELRGFTALRGYPPHIPYLGAGRGRGARAMMADGRWILDFATPGNLFGHGNLDLAETAIRTAASDLVNQGGGAINREPYLLMKAIADRAPAGMTRCALAPSAGDAATMAFELASRRRNCSGLIAFDNRYRYQRILPAKLYRLPEGNPADPDSAAATLEAIREVIGRAGGEIAAMVAEPINTESFRSSPREFLTPIFDECRAAGIMVWMDESRTFARTPQLFATHHVGLANHADMITIAGTIEPAAMLWRPYGKSDPVPTPADNGTIGATVSMAVSQRIIEKLTTEGYLGSTGRISQVEQTARVHLARIATEFPEKISGIDGCGALLSFCIGDGSLAGTRDFVARCFQAGLLLDCTYRDPARVIVRLPAGDLTDPELADAFRIVGDCLS